MGSFSFAGKTIVRPGVLVRTIIGQQKALQLLPFGTLCFVGESDGGIGGGTIYRFDDLSTAKRVLRGGALLNALNAAGAVGGAAGFLAVVVGTKTPSTLAIGAGAATLTSGDQGTWTEGITYTAVAGTSPGTFAVTISYPDPNTGVLVPVGGIGTAFDNLSKYSDLGAAIAADNVLTPPAATGLIPIVQLTVATDGPIAAQSPVNLAGGTGNGSTLPAFADVKVGLDELDEVPFDIGHLVGVYDAPSQAYANGKAQSHEALGYLRRWIHQVQATGASAANKKPVNSTAVANAAIGRATAQNYYRSSVCAQQFSITDPVTGVSTWIDAAPVACGMAAFVGATDQWGPASPLTDVPIPIASDVDYPVLTTTGDVDRAISSGVMLFERIGLPSPGAVRCVQSVTTQPKDPATGLPWILAEFSGVRAADAVLANVKGAITSAKPRAIGGGNTRGTMNSIVATVVGVLELAYDAQWIVGYDPSEIVIGTTGATSMDDLLAYGLSITPPLNHLGITQTLRPYTQVVQGGAVGG